MNAQSTHTIHAPRNTAHAAQHVPAIRQAQHLEQDELFLLGDDESVYTLAKHSDIRQDTHVRWAVCVATNRALAHVGQIIEVRATALVRIVQQTRLGQYEAL